MVARMQVVSPHQVGPGCARLLCDLELHGASGFLLAQTGRSSPHSRDLAFGD